MKLRGAVSSKDEEVGSTDPTVADGSAESPATAKSDLAVKLDRLFELRRKAGEPQMSNAAAAAAIKEETGVSISQTTLWHMRSGSRTKANTEHLRAIAKFFGVPVTYLLEDGFDEDVEAQMKLLVKMRDNGVRNIALRAYGLTPQSLNTISALIDNIRALEQLPPVSSDSDGNVTGDPQ